MGKIKILDQKTASKIAAGEVIERPASVVKELLENSFDASADEIEIYLEKGGKKKILVRDNGEGMDKEDLKICFKPHATSKIRSLDDLNRLNSFGFRGEALHSIAQVSRLTIKSKPENSQTGYQIEVVAGKLKNLLPVGMNKGTEVKVENLFFNLPARKKFLKTDQTELKHILQIIERLALTKPEIKIKVFHNQKQIINLEKTDLKKRIKDLFKVDIEKMFYEGELSRENLKIKIFFSRPQYTPYLPELQILYVNSRFVKIPFLIKKTIKEAYGTLLPPNLNPRFILFLEMPAYFFDVNIHPKKEEIKLLSPTPVLENLKDLMEQIISTKETKFFAKAKTDKTSHFTFKEPVDEYKIHQEIKKTEQAKFFDIFPPETKLQLHRPYLQVFKLFIIFEDGENLIIADQHASHERVLFEKFMEKFKKEKENISQPLLIPEILEPSLSLYQLIKENLPIIEELGFKLEPFGEKLYKITHVPFILLTRNLDIKKTFIEILNDLAKGSKKLPFSIERAVATMACRSAVKAGDKLTQHEIDEIIKLLTRSKVPYTCPHGRPTHVVITKGELEKLFKRK